jgi:hypothetical protein
MSRAVTVTNGPGKEIIMATKYTDRFTDAEKELQEKSAFACETCKKTYNKQDAEQQDMSCCGRTLKELLRESFGP